MTSGSNRPLGVMNAAFHLSPSLIHTLLYPDCRSSLVKIVGFALAMRSNKSSTLGIG